MKTKMTIPGSVALVTGAGSGIGRSTAFALARLGAHVLAVDIDEVGAKTTATTCLDLGSKASSYQCDVADRLAVGELAEQVTSEHGTIDILVSNAGVGMNARFLDMSIDDWEWIRSINLDGAIHCSQAFGPSMVERGRGQVVIVSSGLAYMPLANTIAYGTTKAAVLHFARALRADWGTHGVGVTAVCPGVINTPIIDATRFLGEAGSPSAVAAAKRGFRFGHRPELVADAIVEGIRQNRGFVPVGLEARLGWQLTRMLPLAVANLISRPVPSSSGRRARKQS